MLEDISRVLTVALRAQKLDLWASLAATVSYDRTANIQNFWKIFVGGLNNMTALKHKKIKTRIIQERRKIRNKKDTIKLVALEFIVGRNLPLFSSK